MGVISNLFDIVGLSKKASKELQGNPDNIKAVSSLFAKAKSISAQASKYVLEYPVACSSSITDFNTALAITKQIEFDCARFIILASGLNPVIKTGSGDTIEAHINSLISSYESYSGIKVKISPATTEFEMAGEEYMAKYYSSEAYSIYNMDTSTTELFSSEGSTVDIDDDDADTNNSSSSENYKTFEGKGGYKEIIKDAFSINHPVNDGYFPPIEDIIGQRPSDSTAGEEWDKAKLYYEKCYEISRINTSASSNSVNLVSKLGKVAPTIITLNLFIQDGNGVDREIQLPLAIKATLQFIDKLDVYDMLSDVKIRGKRLLDFIKMTTGQISFFKDWLLALDTAKKDTERERTIGHTPFFRALMNNKSKWKFKTVFGSIPIIKNFIAGKTQRDLPMCTLILDEQELSPLGCKLSDILRNRAKFIDPIIDEFMLLGIGIIDHESDILYIFYSGETSPVTAKISDLTESSKSQNMSNDLAKALANMSKLVVKH